MPGFWTAPVEEPPPLQKMSVRGEHDDGTPYWFRPWARVVIAGTVAGMDWGRLGNAEWWWEYALDGVLGGVIGGVATALAVWWTLRHEARRTSVEGARAVAAKITSGSFLLSRALLATGESAADEEWRIAAELFASGEQLAALSHRRWPEFSDAVVELTRDVMHAMAPSGRDDERREVVNEALRRLGTRVSDWVAQQ